MNPNGFTYISWSNLLKKYVDIQSEANTLKRLAALEKKTKPRPAKSKKRKVNNQKFLYFKIATKLMRLKKCLYGVGFQNMPHT